MIHIIRSKTAFAVATTGKNGEPLNRSEDLSSKQKCWVNIAADGENFNGDTYLVQDETTAKTVVYRMWSGGEKIKNHSKPVPRYVPGKNKKKLLAKRKNKN